MNEQHVREIVRDELSKVEVIFSTPDIKDGEDAGNWQLIARLSLPKEPNQTTVRASGNRNGQS